MMKHGYPGEFEITGDHRAGKIVVTHIGRLNKCGVSSLKFDVQLNDLEKWQYICFHPSVWFHCTDNLNWHHGSQRSKMKIHKIEKSRSHFLVM
jgi:hypothetical protein